MKYKSTNRTKLIVRLSLLALTFTCSREFHHSHAEPLSQLAIFMRCYAQFTQLRASSTDPLYVAVANGSTTAVDACMAVFDRARLTVGARTIANPADPVAKAVINNFHNLHASWFQTKAFPNSFGAGPELNNRDLFDSSNPAAYYTKALFGPSIQASFIVTTPQYLRIVRTDNDPSAGVSTYTKPDYVFGSAIKFAARGDMIGVEQLNRQIWHYNYTVNSSGQVLSGDVAVNDTRGGGFLGSQDYILSTVDEVSTFKATGGLGMPRKWARSLFHDALCRDLPAVRQADGNSFVVPTSAVEFRQTANCVKCHASIDRASSVIRNFKYKIVAGSGLLTPRWGGFFTDLHPTDMPAETGWPSAVDANYYRRPTRGTFYYRSYNGTLVNVPINSVQELGNQIANTNDFYVCIAKRYYQYFTGIDADIADLGDPEHGALSAEHLIHRNIIIGLGVSLKTHQNLRTLVRDIINHPRYRLSDFGLLD
jgi:hypothetical protein